MTIAKLGGLLCLLLGTTASQMHAAERGFSDNVIKIGILNDRSGAYADLGGEGSVVAAKMAAEEFGNAIDGVPIEIVSADHQNKPDIGLGVVRRWFDTEKVDVVAVRHYLRAVRVAKTDDGLTVAAKMRELPLSYAFAAHGQLRADGQFLHDMYIARVKKPAGSERRWDYYDIVATIPAEQAFRPISESGCALVSQ